MKITLISGSPRKEGNTATVLQSIKKSLPNYHVIKRIDIAEYNINGCLGCSKCQAVMNTPACIQKDDTNTLLEMLMDSELIIYGTPLYGHCYSSQLKTFLDRQVALFKFIEGKDKSVSEMEMKSLIAGKLLMLLVTCQGPEENNTEIVKLLFDKYCESSQTVSLGKFIVPFCTNNVSETWGKSKGIIKKIAEIIRKREDSQCGQATSKQNIC